jgi:hypothetical protein
MDDSRFDRLVIGWANPRSRRRLLTSLVPALAGLLAEANLVAAGKKHKQHKQHKQHRRHHKKPACCGATCPKKCGFGGDCVVDADCFNNVCLSSPNVLGLCADCRIDSDCDGLGDPRKFRCFDNTCFECAADFDCPRPGQSAAQKFCVEPVAGGCPANTRCACRQCRTSDDCESDEFCDETNTCIARCASGREIRSEGCECASDTNCEDPDRPFCVPFPGTCSPCTCAQCRSNEDCPADQPVCLIDHCIDAATCPAGHDLCTQGFGAATACLTIGSATVLCRCHTTTEGDTQCSGGGAIGGVGCEDARVVCDSSADCVGRFGPGHFCAKAGPNCQCNFCHFVCERPD